jgi:hypothetical protein
MEHIDTEYQRGHSLDVARLGLKYRSSDASFGVFSVAPRLTRDISCMYQTWEVERKRTSLAHICLYMYAGVPGVYAKRHFLVCMCIW